MTWEWVVLLLGIAYAFVIVVVMLTIISNNETNRRIERRREYAAETDQD